MQQTMQRKETNMAIKCTIPDRPDKINAEQLRENCQFRQTEADMMNDLRYVSFENKYYSVTFNWLDDTAVCLICEPKDIDLPMLICSNGKISVKIDIEKIIEPKSDIIYKTRQRQIESVCNNKYVTCINIAEISAIYLTEKYTEITNSLE